MGPVQIQRITVGIALKREVWYNVVILFEKKGFLRIRFCSPSTR